ncbi:hypothetical protein OG21DRAFT_1484844 [Imleria badia]|nr:hypothetical protein OG21DRAFT_1484844 [Imleria badia]
MQYNHYPTSAHQAHPATHPSHSPDEYSASYPDPSQHHSTMSYAAVTPTSHLPSAHQNIPPQYPYSPYATQSPATQSPPDDHRSYYATSSQGSAIEHYPSASSPTSSYATPSPSSHLNQQTCRHHAHLAHHQQQFIPTPSQAYQVYSSTPPASSARSRSSVEPYYHMSPNPQHVMHASPASTTHAASGTGGRSNTAHGSGSNSTQTGTIVVAAGERYPCDLCDRSFTRLHDRRRHYETVHATSPVLHKCRFCRKDFSRSDSLKRHVDNGCDEMPR